MFHNVNDSVFIWRKGIWALYFSLFTLGKLRVISLFNGPLTVYPGNKIGIYNAIALGAEQ